MLAYMSEPRHGYVNHFREVSILRRPEWRSQASGADKVRYLAGRYWRYWDALCCHPVVDGVDGTGVAPVVPAAMLVLAGAGAFDGLVRRRQPLAALGVLVVLVMPLGAVLSVDGLARRSFAAAPFLALFAALPVGRLLDWCRTPGADRRARAVAFGTAALLALLIVQRNLDDYFDRFARSAEQRWIFAEELTDAAQFMDTLPTGSRVYFYSERWPFDYETRQFLAPRISGEDRSVEFGARPGMELEHGEGPVIFLFLGRYQMLAEQAQRCYPGGTAIVGGPPGGPTFVAYQVAAGLATQHGVSHPGTAAVTPQDPAAPEHAGATWRGCAEASSGSAAPDGPGRKGGRDARE